MQMPQTLELHNGDKAPATFSPKEYARRLSALRAYMAQQDIDAALFTSYHNINYYAGFLYCSFGRQYALVVTQEHSVLISANIDGGQPGRRATCDAQVIYTDWQRGNFFVAVKQALPRASRLGLEFDHLTLPNHRAFAELYPQAQLLDIAAPCMNLRMLKSAEEQALIRQGARIADIGGAAAIEALHDQVPEYEVAGHATQAMVRAIAEAFPGAELMDTWTWFQSGLNTDGAHNPLTSRRVSPGEVLSLNCFPMIAGYYTALERTLFLGHCPDACLRLWEINVQVHEAGLQLVKPGARCSDIARQLNALYLEHDLLQYRTFGYGHSFGILNHYYGRETGLEFREDVETILEPGMVVSIEPMIRLPEGLPGAGGYREHDILIVDELGACNITGLPYGPRYNIIGS
ncbi:M24 family metallopeptidase [Pseudomonas protegens]|uniref:aminopeptidase P family protein n=1 Tax=Pseudomonas TaxID=286 RepID=UPI00090834E2|nr:MULTISPECIES: aminopeptidase P family protein [Pseudomonas]APC22363.1 creatininase [Pseudomonas protegens]MDT9642861.1 M24 family metallopeptidase [Pseudomonas sp. JV245A]NAN52961.1 M24 family metallopeptidase [Pseudomonas protegens]NUE75570.1 M24 family metallopeptidase [Pseudomonas protegens]